MKDPHLPQLGTVLNAGVMAAELAGVCLGSPDRWEVRDCSIGHIRYKPGKRCLVRYDATLWDRRLNTGRGQMWYGLAYAPGSSESRWRKAVNTGSGAAHCEHLGMVVWPFPNDRKLEHLSALLDPARVADEIIRPALGAVKVGQPQIVRYIPEHGCTVRIPVGETAYYAKIQHGADGQITSRHATALGREAWHVAHLGVTVQREIHGKSGDAETDLEACAAALARLHQTNVPGLAPAACHLDSLEQARVLLRPRAEGVDEVLDEIARQWTASGTAVTLHGDLHLNNFLVHHGRGELIDLDTLQLGDPMNDLGSFAASLYHRALLRGSDFDAAHGVASGFLAAYAAQVPWPVEIRRFELAVARALIEERACRSVTRCKGDVVAPLLAIARGLLWSADASTPRGRMENFALRARARQGQILDVSYRTFRKAKSQGKSNVAVAWQGNGRIRVEQIGPHPRHWEFPQDPVVPWMEIAADPRRVIDHLPLTGIQDVAIEILTYRPENRLTARYDIRTEEGMVSVYGKTYSDERGAAVDARLRQLNEMGFPMPAPLGYSPEIKTVWQQALNGEPLLSHITAGAADTHLLNKASERLRFLHDSALECPPRLTLEEQHTDLAKKMAKLAKVAPEYTDSLLSQVDSLGRMLPRLGAARHGVVHGDFHLRQMMVADDDVALFDFDEIGAGDLAEDFGYFTADLHTYGHGEDWAEAVSANLRRAYEQQAACKIPEDRLRWHTALQLLTRGYRALVQLKPDFDTRVHRAIRLAKEIL